MVTAQEIDPSRIVPSYLEGERDLEKVLPLMDQIGRYRHNQPTEVYESFVDSASSLGGLVLMKYYPPQGGDYELAGIARLKDDGLTAELSNFTVAEKFGGREYGVAEQLMGVLGRVALERGRKKLEAFCEADDSTDVPESWRAEYYLKHHNFKEGYEHSIPGRYIYRDLLDKHGAPVDPPLAVKIPDSFVQRGFDDIFDKRLIVSTDFGAPVQATSEVLQRLGHALEEQDHLRILVPRAIPGTRLQIVPNRTSYGQDDFTHGNPTPWLRVGFGELEADLSDEPIYGRWVRILTNSHYVRLVHRQHQFGKKPTYKHGDQNIGSGHYIVSFMDVNNVGSLGMTALEKFGVFEFEGSELYPCEDDEAIPLIQAFVNDADFLHKFSRNLPIIDRTARISTKTYLSR